MFFFDYLYSYCTSFGRTKKLTGFLNGGSRCLKWYTSCIAHRFLKLFDARVRQVLIFHHSEPVICILPETFRRLYYLTIVITISSNQSHTMVDLAAHVLSHIDERPTADIWNRLNTVFFIWVRDVTCSKIIEPFTKLHKKTFDRPIIGSCAAFLLASQCNTVLMFFRDKIYSYSNWPIWKCTNLLINFRVPIAHAFRASI